MQGLSPAVLSGTNIAEYDANPGSYTTYNFGQKDNKFNFAGALQNLGTTNFG